MTFEEIKEIISGKFPEAVKGEDLNSTPQALLIKAEFIHGICEYIHSHKQLYFDVLSCLTGLDNGATEGTMEIIYNLYSIPNDLHLMLRVKVLREELTISTVSDIWRTANWHEREIYDLLGIRFENHPDLRRILLPDDWKGHPLREDYQEMDTYHGMTVVYDRDESAPKIVQKITD